MAILSGISIKSQAALSQWLAGAGSASLGETIDPGRMRHLRSRKHIQRAGQALTKAVHPATSLFYLPTSDKSKAFCIKIFDVSQPGNRDFFCREVAMLRKLGQFSPDESKALAPRVFMADADAGLLVMEWVVGRSVKQDLMLRYLLRRDTSSLLYNCGIWLRRFHLANEIKLAPAPAFEKLHDIEQRLSGLGVARQQQVMACPRFSRGLEWLRQKAPDLDGVQVEWSMRHGDFTPSNLICDRRDGNLTGIDFGISHERQPVSIDLAGFILRASDLTISRISWMSVSHRLHDAVTSGYNGDRLDAEYEWQNWCLIYISLLRVVETADAAGQQQSNLISRVRRSLRRWLVHRAARLFLPLATQRRVSPDKFA